MLLELRVENLGVIGDLSLVFAPGLTALTGETGAGKTLVVGAIELLVGGRADPIQVGTRAEEARIEGRFVSDDAELVLSRVVPKSGRSRAYINGRLATAGELADAGRGLVDLHGQHAHQSLLAAVTQRSALDRFGRIDLQPLSDARGRLAAAAQQLEGLGGDSRARAREIDLLRFQIGELAEAHVEDADEDEHLEVEEDTLADAVAHRAAGTTAYEALVGDGKAADAIGVALASCSGRRPLAEAERKLAVVAIEIAEAASNLRAAIEGIPEDARRLEEVRTRRRLLRDLSRKYGEQLSEVITFEADARVRLAELEAHDDHLVALEAEREVARAAVTRAAIAVGRARREAAPRLASAVEKHLRALAMPSARFEVTVGDNSGDAAGDDVSYLLGANPGQPALPLSKVASGGELARTMLAARLVLTEAPPTLVFDEVDAGVGGAAALAVGRALASLSATRQVIVVTHLPQVAAFADHQVAITKSENENTVAVEAVSLRGQDRVVELSRMLSGQPTSATAHGHAEELLATATRERELDRTAAG
ncbi:MAG TPA: DNA repair protein RecN [Acidimicrobiales bacterium]|nr:DNA repair protein RecN [Acidimicrobiales bacterium]